MDHFSPSFKSKRKSSSQSQQSTQYFIKIPGSLCRFPFPKKATGYIFTEEGIKNVNKLCFFMLPPVIDIELLYATKPPSYIFTRTV